MRTLRYISVLSLCLSLSLALVAQDDQRLNERQVMGTARYVGMSGAMTAVGGDPSAVNDNPAGLGVYRRSEVMLTMDYQHDRTRQAGLDSLSETAGQFMVPQVSFVIAIGDPDLDEGVVSNNVMISYSRLRSYARRYHTVMGPDCSMGSVLSDAGIDLGIDYPTFRNNAVSEMRLRESGYANEYNVDWAMNISHRLYIGAGLRMYSYRFAADMDYTELFATKNAEGKYHELENINSLVLSGFGVGGSFGLIYRPCGWLRLGAAIHTPTLNTVNASYTGTMWARTDSLRYSDAPALSERWKDYHAPLHASFGAALQVGDYGLLSLQYDLNHTKSQPMLHTLRAGLEVVPVPGLYLNAGYGYESTFRRSQDAVSFDPDFLRQDMHYQRPLSTQYASGAIGYRGHMFLVQLAYQYRWQRLRMYAHEAASPIDINADTHRVVLTLGWHN